MNMSRRASIATFGAAAGVRCQEPKPETAPGPFQPTKQSLEKYAVPGWFRDAKFGIWACWGPQAAPEYGDWYARNMYIQGSRQYFVFGRDNPGI